MPQLAFTRVPIFDPVLDAQIEKTATESADKQFLMYLEGAQLESSKVIFVSSWLRTTKKGQRTRIIIASNPPIGGEGEWLIEWFAPWLDPMYPNPAVPGELRWAFIGPDGHTVWTDNGNIVRIGTEEYQPLTRTFIPARLEDNPYLDSSSNGLSYLVERLKGQGIVGHITLAKSERSELASLVTAEL